MPRLQFRHRCLVNPFQRNSFRKQPDKQLAVVIDGGAQLYWNGTVGYRGKMYPSLHAFKSLYPGEPTFGRDPQLMAESEPELPADDAQFGTVESEGVEDADVANEFQEKETEVDALLASYEESLQESAEMEDVYWNVLDDEEKKIVLECKAEMLQLREARLLELQGKAIRPVEAAQEPEDLESVENSDSDVESRSSHVPSSDSTISGLYDQSSQESQNSDGTEEVRDLPNSQLNENAQCSLMLKELEPEPPTGPLEDMDVDDNSDIDSEGTTVVSEFEDEPTPMEGMDGWRSCTKTSLSLTNKTVVSQLITSAGLAQEDLETQAAIDNEHQTTEEPSKFVRITEDQKTSKTTECEAKPAAVAFVETSTAVVDRQETVALAEATDSATETGTASMDEVPHIPQALATTVVCENNRQKGPLDIKIETIVEYDSVTVSPESIVGSITSHVTNQPSMVVKMAENKPFKRALQLPAQRNLSQAVLNRKKHRVAKILTTKARKSSVQSTLPSTPRNQTPAAVETPTIVLPQKHQAAVVAAPKKSENCLQSKNIKAPPTQVNSSGAVPKPDCIPRHTSVSDSSLQVRLCPNKSCNQEQSATSVAPAESSSNVPVKRSRSEIACRQNPSATSFTTPSYYSSVPNPVTYNYYQHPMGIYSFNQPSMPITGIYNPARFYGQQGSTLLPAARSSSETAWFGAPGAVVPGLPVNYLMASPYVPGFWPRATYALTPPPGTSGPHEN